MVFSSRDNRRTILTEWVKIIGADTNNNRGWRGVNLAVALAGKLGLYRRIELIDLNLLDVDSTAETLRKFDCPKERRYNYNGW